jgi:hypothetical protein
MKTLFNLVVAGIFGLIMVALTGATGGLALVVFLFFAWKISVGAANDEAEAEAARVQAQKDELLETLLRKHQHDV